MYAIRCDRNIPCEQCSRSKSEMCTYLCDDEHLTDSGRATDRVKQPRLNNTRPTAIRKNPSSTSSIARPEHGFTPSRGTSLPYFDLPEPKSSFLHDMLHGKNSLINPEPPQSLYSEGEFLSGTKVFDIAPVSPPNTHDESPVVRGIFSKTRFFGQSHWMNSVYQVRRSLVIYYSCELKCQQCVMHLMSTPNFFYFIYFFLSLASRSS